MADRYIIVFFIYAFLGYVSEVIFCSVPQRRFVNRGFLYGPWLPIYGFGAMIVLIILHPFASYPVLVFIMGFLFTSCLEYFTSWLLEKLFSVKLWDYSKHKVNINGRVCLRNSLLFGIMSLAVEYLVQPWVARIVGSISPMVIHPLAVLLTALFAADFSLSVVRMKSFRDGLAKVRAFRREAEERVRALQGEGKAELAEELRARLEAMLERYKESVRHSARSVILSNPSLSSRNEEVQRQLLLLHEWALERRAMKRRHRDELRKMDQDHIDAIRNAGR